VQQEKRRKIDELVRVETELLRLKLDAQATVHFLTKTHLHLIYIADKDTDPSI
jgi:hypothetical protein